MTPDKIDAAIYEAKRFLAKAVKVKQHHYEGDKDKRDLSFLAGSKHTGALRRASMDLTRALAEMRKP